MPENEMPKAYESADIEAKWYPFWEENGLFKGRPNKDKKPYSIVIPPPNVTGILTMGHVLNNTLQDILIRWHRMLGEEVCWFPGTDHAGIATEARVEKYLRENEHTGREELGREEFIRRVWSWKEQYGGKIIRQLRKLGTSCDWERERFTMDEGLSDAVKQVFVQLYNKGYIYRGRRMINWCPKAKSALSDEEVIYKEDKGKFYHFRYPISDGSGYLVVATTRPETMFGDTAVAVHPDDPRYKHLIGKTVDLPLTDRKIVVVGDVHADPEKGTGCVKITPAHDPNDFEVGKRHNLEFINVMNKDGTMNARCGKYEGQDRFVCRENVVKDIEKLGLLEKIEDIVHNVGYSERGGVPIETLISEQWFVRMDELAKPAIEAVKTGKIKFYPERWAKTYFHWMENIKDWCISRQIWWGHRIPAWYKDATGEVYVGVNPPEGEGWRQEEDVLDTWFSSWLWPFSIMGWPKDTEEQKFFYPTNDLVTGPDIIFFWVARMIMAGYEFKGELPFRNVYFTSIIRDDLGRKLSKSLGNSPDPLEVIAQYGADALRFSIVYIAPVGMDIRYSNEKCEIGRNFANKLWNACRFRKMQGEVTQGRGKCTFAYESLSSDEKWMLSHLDKAIKGIDSSLKDFRFHSAAHDLYELVWSDFCDWFIETCKRGLRGTEEEKRHVLEVLDFVLWNILKMLHPFMPFVTEELSHQMGFVDEGDSIMFKSFPVPLAEQGIALGADAEKAEAMNSGKFELATAGRSLRLANGIPPGKKIAYHVKAANAEALAFLNEEKPSLNILLNASDVTVSTDEYKSDDGSPAPSVMVNIGAVYLPLKGLVDMDAEKDKLLKQKKELEGWIKSSEGKLANKNFVEKAPAKVIEDARKQLAELKEKLARVDEALKGFAKA